ncbi:MAG TPA: alpha/beta fold hydrolase [Patescibacteria group bacterium]|nr:alpha/beta fold hydrolase [Patescibacteria group bacterium]
MKPVSVILACLALGGVLAAGQFGRGVSAETARYVIQELASHRFAAAAARFDGPLRAALPEDRLAALWSSLEEQVGKFEGVRGVVVSGQSTPTFTLVCQFERADLDAVLTFNAYGQLSGLFFRQSALAKWTPPSYAQPENFTEVPVTVKTGRWSLPGTLTVPKGNGPFPAVVLVQGSGPEDQDETVGLNKPFKDLAWGLANRSIAVLRYTKRTLRYGAASSIDPATFTVNDEIVDDARSAVSLLAQQPQIDSRCVFLLGHSFGATVAPRIAAGDHQIAGLVLMASAVTPIERLALDQVRAIDARQDLAPGVAQKQIAEAEAEVRRIESPGLKPGATVSFLGAEIPSSYWLDLRHYHPGSVAAALRIPILVLQGGRDYQVPPSEMGRWKKALASHTNASLELFPDLNHLFEAGAGPSSPVEYLRAGHVDEKVIAAIASWIEAAPGPIGK